MATDRRRTVSEFSAFYDFAGRTVLAVGAGGGQIVEYARPARHVIAVDRDGKALEQLSARLAESGLAGKFTLVASDVFDVCSRADVVLFEFSLHEIAEPGRALSHARTLAPEVVIIDHAPGSLWEWYAAEDAEVEAAWKAVEREVIRRQRSVKAWQRFSDYAELESKLAGQGPASRERIASFRGQSGISIPMPYRLALLGAPD